jgi:hypothetical protein
MHNLQFLDRAEEAIANSLSITNELIQVDYIIFYYRLVMLSFLEYYGGYSNIHDRFLHFGGFYCFVRRSEVHLSSLHVILCL